jgi:hypothetical protein
MITQTQALTTLSYLLGENSVPTSSVLDSRKNFIQNTLNEIYRAYPWSFAAANATLTFASGIATLPADFDYQHKIYGYFYNGSTQTQLDEINIGDSDMYIQNQYKFWIEHVIDDTFQIKTKDTNYTTAVISYQTEVPTLSSTVSTPFNDANIIALGAKRYVKASENPDADISQDEALFQKRLNEVIGAVQVNRPLRKHRNVYYANNYRLGEN